MASARQRENGRSTSRDSDNRLEDCESIIRHMKDSFSSFCAKKGRGRPSLEGLEFAGIMEESALRLEWEFKEEKVQTEHLERMGSL